MGSGFSREKSKCRGTSYLEDRGTLRHKLSRVVFGEPLYLGARCRTYLPQELEEAVLDTGG